MTGILKVSILGTLPSTEVWSVNPVWALPTGDFPLPYDDLLTIATAINAVNVPSTMVAMWSTGTAMTGVRLEHRSESGTLLSQLEQPRSGPTPGTSSTPQTFQASVVTSLRTALSGAHYRGRLYWPGTGAPLVSSTLRINSVTLNSFLTGVKTYLSGVEDAIQATSAGAVLSVWSRSLSSTQGVNRILAGDLLDVQRRRRDTASEAYLSATWP